MTFIQSYLKFIWNINCAKNILWTRKLFASVNKWLKICLSYLKVDEQIMNLICLKWWLITLRMTYFGIKYLNEAITDSKNTLNMMVDCFHYSVYLDFLMWKFLNELQRLFWDMKSFIVGKIYLIFISFNLWVNSYDYSFKTLLKPTKRFTSAIC